MRVRLETWAKEQYAPGEAPSLFTLRRWARQGGVNTKDLLGHSTERAANLYLDARGAEALLVRVG